MQTYRYFEVYPAFLKPDFIVHTSVRKLDLFVEKGNTLNLNFSLINIKKKNYFNFIKFIITLSFTLNYAWFRDGSDLHCNYKLLFFSELSNRSIIHSNKYIMKWLDSFLLIYNIFYFNLTILFFGSVIFKKNILAFNWNNANFKINLWKKNFNFFFTKTNSFDTRIDIFCERLAYSGYNLCFITDCYFHSKNIYYFNKFNFFSIGLISSNSNPWQVSFAIPVGISNIFLQFLFIKFVLIIKKYVNQLKYEHYKFLWFKNTNILEK